MPELLAEMLTRSAPIGATSFNPETRTALAVLASETPVRRPWGRPDGRMGPWIEILVASGADLSRAAGASVLVDHRNSARERVGVIEAASVAGREIHARLKFSGRPEIAPLLDDLRELGSQLSVGYEVAAWAGPEDQRADVPTFRATAWTLLETSLVAVAADPAAKVRAKAMDTGQNTADAAATVEGNSAARAAEITKTPAGAGGADPALVERERAAQIRQAARVLKIDASVADQLVADGVPLEQARTAMFSAAAARDSADAALSAVRGGHDGAEPDFRARQCVNALAHRLSGGRIALAETAAPVRGMRIMEMHKYVGDLRERSHAAGSWLSRSNLGGAHTTTDYPVLLLESAANRALLDSFMIAASPLRQVARVIQVDDFRQITRARRGEAAALLEIGEHGEVQSSTVGEEKERYVVKTYARNYALTRNAIVNDDLDAFGDFLADMGRAAAITEAAVLVGLITGDGVVLDDGTTLWHANHGNLAGSGAAPDVTTLGAARSSMRLQKSPTNAEPLNLVPRFILAPAALETTVDKLIGDISATTTAEFNPFAGRLVPLIEPRLDAISAAAWYVVADPASMPFLEIATLNGSRPMATAGGPELRTFEGEDVLGLKYRAVHDFGAHPINFRAAFKNPGAGG